MKVVRSGNNFNVYDNSMKTYDQLPVSAYTVNFNEHKGFFLSLYKDIEINEKIYGVHEKKANKVIQAFKKIKNRNLGVILSGDKGIGKSLFSKILSQKAMAAGLPLIIVNEYMEEIAGFLDSIDQEVMILFDEFDKTFPYSQNGDYQVELLSLFDGIAQGKKLFVITCNDVKSLNEYLINRPGRFHYHFRFEYPNIEEITAYLEDNLSPENYGEIDSICIFSKKVKLNYDCLRSIVFELNMGSSFKEAIKDLNIMNTTRGAYDVFIKFADGRIFNRVGYLNLFDSLEPKKELFIEDEEAEIDIFSFKFDIHDIKYDREKDTNIIPGDKIQVYLLIKNEKSDLYKKYQKYEKMPVEYVSFVLLDNTKQLHYEI